MLFRRNLGIHPSHLAQIFWANGLGKLEPTVTHAPLRHDEPLGKELKVASVNAFQHLEPLNKPDLRAAAVAYAPHCPRPNPKVVAPLALGPAARSNQGVHSHTKPLGLFLGAAFHHLSGYAVRCSGERIGRGNQRDLLLTIPQPNDKLPMPRFHRRVQTRKRVHSHGDYGRRSGQRVED